MKKTFSLLLAVGVAHMVGEAGLVQLLRNAGCTVVRLDY